APISLPPSLSLSSSPPKSGHQEQPRPDPSIRPLLDDQRSSVAGHHLKSCHRENMCVAEPNRSCFW
ncbi:hypothetical protein PanWU01x14_184840, partial [Parasponia andersonii]